MAAYIGSRLILNESEMQSMQFRMANPSPDSIIARDALFQELDEMHITELEDGSVGLDFDIIIDLPSEKDKAVTSSESVVVFSHGDASTIEARTNLIETALLAA